MKNVILAMFLATFTLNAFAFASDPNTTKENKMSDEQKKVLNVIGKMTTSVKNKDIEGVMSTYEPNAVIYFQPEMPISDDATQRQIFQGLFAANADFTFYGHEVYITDNIATHINPWSMTATGPDGKQMRQEGLSIAVLRKQKNGQWLMIIDNPYGTHIMQTQTTGKETVEQKKVQNNINNMTASFAKKDLDGIMATYEKGATIVFKPGKPLTDEKKIRKMYKKFFSVNPTFSFHGHEVIINGDVSLHLNPWKMKGKIFGIFKMKKEGLSVVISRKQANGEWRMILDEPNGDHLVKKAKLDIL
ncbi:YybH family protein [Maribacter litoralis]|uniref:YybH family protein n=1 Tax=Maribacter litoralis TaxID=2059726 RepID=UPI000C63A983|nr:hypothetical protein [Allomuricauda sp.]|tara:strand:- start:7451 stop:8359 length:909 start_codon:yes stop_codon:yes gene_type:complete